MTLRSLPARPLTGRHVLAMFVVGFGIIISVNVTMAYTAVSTFPGLEVKNSYIASQSFDRRRAAQQAAGWTAQASYADGILQVAVSNHDGVVDGQNLTGMIGRPTTRVADQALVFDGAGRMALDLAPGRWRIDLATKEGAAPFAQMVLLTVSQ